MKRIAAMVMILACCWGKGEAIAGSFFTGPDRRFNIATILYGTMGFSTIAYFMYKNSPAQRTKGYAVELGPGEWYVGAYTGLSYLPPADWKFNSNFPSPLSTETGLPLTGPGLYAGRKANITYEPGVVGGIKFGRYLDSCPWFGWEFETSFSRNRIRGDQGNISPPPAVGPTKLMGGSDWFMNWVMQYNLLARYGLWQDKEVTFGRLQPYVGIGPTFEILYGRYDSAKNLGIGTMAGVRYLFTPKVALFFEYKFSYQFAIEYQNVLVSKYGYDGTLTFDVPHHRFVIGVSYHFKNLYGN